MLSVLNVNSPLVRYTTTWSGSSLSALSVQSLRGSPRRNGPTAGSAMSSMSCSSYHVHPDIEVCDLASPSFSMELRIFLPRQPSTMLHGVSSVSYSNTSFGDVISLGGRSTTVCIPRLIILHVHSFPLFHTRRCPLRRPRHGACMFSYTYFLLFTIPSKWYDWCEQCTHMVGEHRIFENCRWPFNAASSGQWNVWVSVQRDSDLYFLC